MSSLGLPFEFTLPALWQSHFDTWSFRFEETANQDVQMYQNAVENWLLNAREHGLLAAGIPPAVPLRMRIWKIDGAEPGTALGPDPVCGADPRIALMLNPPVVAPPTTFTPKVGPPYANDPTRFFAFGDVCPNGYTFTDPARGPLVKVIEEPEPFSPTGRKYWLKKGA